MKSITKKTSKSYLNFVARIVIIMSVLLSCRTNYEMPDDFGFCAKFGKFRGKTVNTYDSIYTKLLYPQVDTTVHFVLSKADKEVIFEQIMKYEIYKYPSNFYPKPGREIMPSPYYYIDIYMNGITYRINWDINTHSREKKARRLRSVFELIDKISSNYKVVNSLPADSLGFM